MRYGLQPDGSRKEEPQGLETPTFDDKNWKRLSVPHDWAIEGPFREELEGGTGKLPWKAIGWYRKHFSVPAADKSKKIFIDFDGAMAYAKIYCNGKYAGEWPYGYTSFRMDVTPYLNWGGENVLAVQLNTEKWDSRWYPGAGIYRHVWLVKTNVIHVAHWGTFITTPQADANAATVEIKTAIQNEGENAEAEVTHALYELSENDEIKKQAGSATGKVSVAARGSAEIALTLKIQNPKLWDINSPNRYVAVTTVKAGGKLADTYYTPFGVRTFKATPRDGFILNGKRVPIQGTCNHHDLGALGAAFNASALERQLKILKEMGCNSLRTSHNPPAPELLTLADKMGFIVWDEAFDTWKNGKRPNDYSQLFEQWHVKDLQAMVRRDRNHPSVMIWSIGNEVMDQRDVALTKHLTEIVKEVDATRPVSNGYNDPDGGRESGACTALDIMGVNYFFGKQPQWDNDPRYKDKPTVGSETSSCVSSRGEYFFNNTKYQNWQISSYDNAFPGWGCTPDTQFATNEKFPHLLGEYVWTGFDYLGEPTPYNSDETNLLNYRTDPEKKKELEKKLEELKKKRPPSRSSYFGMADLCGFPKDRYYMYQSVWRPELPMAHILPHWNWPSRIDSITPVHVYTSGDEAELFLNGKSLGRKKKEAHEFRLVWDDVIYRPGELLAVAYKNGKEWAKDLAVTAGEPYKLSLSADKKTAPKNGDELCFITVKVNDKNGRFVPVSHAALQFSAEGGEIVATDNGDATCFIPFPGYARPAFNGMALAIVRPLGKKIKVTVASKGLQSGVIIIPSK